MPEPMSREEELAMLKSLLTQREDPRAQDQTPLDTRRGKFASDWVSDPILGGSKAYEAGTFNVPTDAAGIGTLDERKAYDAQAAQEFEKQRQKRVLEEAVDALLKRGGKQYTPRSGWQLPEAPR